MEQLYDECIVNQSAVLRRSKKSNHIIKKICIGDISYPKDNYRNLVLILNYLPNWIVYIKLIV